MATKKNTKTTDSAEVKNLKKQIEELKNMVLGNMGNSNNTSIDMENEDIIFISLYPGILNLTSTFNGTPIEYTFTYFGEEKNIPYIEAKALIRQNTRFISGGLVYIDSPEFIKKERLATHYKNIINKDTMLGLFELDKSSFEKIFSSIPKMQQEVFARLVEKKIANNEDIDMNIVQSINLTLKIDIMTNINNGKDLTTEE